MNGSRYSATIGDSLRIAESVAYETLIANIVEFTVRATLARSNDRADWEHEELRRKGLGAVQLFRDRTALWEDREEFEAELTEARREGIGERFVETNAADQALYERLDSDLRARWRSAGYETPSLRRDMRALFAELERDINDREAGTREAFVREIMNGIS